MISSLELARRCGVSQGTVDRALHGRSGIAEDTRKRILKAAKTYGYAPNPMARELMTGKSETCGAVIPSGRSIFFMDLFEAIQRVLHDQGLSLLMVPAGNADETSDALRMLASRRPRALLLVPPSEDYEIPSDILGSGPLISLANPCKGATYLAPDEQQTGWEGAKFLWELGHREIAHITYSQKFSAISERRIGYEKFLRSKKKEPIMLTDPRSEQLEELVKRKKVSALFCHNDWLALDCLRALEKIQIKVPQTVSILGVDYAPTFRELFPGLSSLAYPYQELAENVARLIKGSSLRVISPLKAISGTTTDFPQ